MRPLRMRCVAVSLCIAAVLVFCSAPAVAQTDSGTVSGRVLDPTGLSISGAHVRLIDIDRDTAEATVTNNSGLYTFHAVHPGRYRMEVEAKGFKVVNVTSLTVNTQANLEQNFELSVGSVSESITVEAKASDISTSVNTVVDRQIVENLPLNGRSFQSLMQLTPGVVITPTSTSDSGQFSVNGQRASANYFMVDGVSANIGAGFSNFATQNTAGAIPGFSVLGGTSNLVSVDALQEFRIQTSTYAPEFGRTPGAQVSIETRSGTNQFHGALFEYLRNDVLDASDWFNGKVQSGTPPLKKSQERQNDFGGVFGGPIFKNKTFFFFSYEGEILRLPRTAISKVPSLAVRQSPTTPAAILPLLQAYPLPNQSPTGADVANELAPYVASFSDQSTLNAVSLRIDHRFSDDLEVFGRYNYSPSDLVTHGDGTIIAVNGLTRFAVKTQTLTLGAVWAPTANTVNDLRFNYSRNRASGTANLDSLGGAIVPPESFFLPAPFSTKTSEGVLTILSAGSLLNGVLPSNLQRQINLVDGFAIEKGRHALKFGADYRRLSPTVTQPTYSLSAAFLNVSSAVSLTPVNLFVTSNNPVNVRFHNLGAYAEDTWKMSPRLTLTYGVRWDVDFSPSTVDGPDFLSLTNVNDPLTIGLAPSGTPLFHTKYANFAPRVGAAYLLKPAPNYQTVLRGGFGVFYDLATQQAANVFQGNLFPFGSSRSCSIATCPGLTFPLPSDLVQPPPSVLSPTQTLIGFDPGLNLPYTLQWNAAVEQSLGAKQTLSASYVGAIGRRLIQQEFLFAQTRFVDLIGDHATSDYHALQLQFRRQVFGRLHALGSYTWSHSFDTASSSNTAIVNAFERNLDPRANRGPSDFDVRHSFSAGITYAIPDPKDNKLLKEIAGGWSLDSMVQGRTATPVDVFSTGTALIDGSLLEVRPNLVPGQPLYLHGSACAVLSGGQCPGGQGFNPAAFAKPPAGTLGNLGRNALRGFGAFQWDFATQRDFALRESLHLKFRAEFFNVLNHPNFANPNGNLLSPLFGVSTTMLNRGLGAGAVASGGFSPLYQIGGPRSGQLALKLTF